MEFACMVHYAFSNVYMYHCGNGCMKTTPTAPIVLWAKFQVICLPTSTHVDCSPPTALLQTVYCAMMHSRGSRAAALFIWSGWSQRFRGRGRRRESEGFWTLFSFTALRGCLFSERLTYHVSVIASVHMVGSQLSCSVSNPDDTWKHFPITE